MNDEICFVNLNLGGLFENGSICDYSPPDHIIERICINVLLGQYWSDISEIKELLKQIILDNPKIDGIISKITDRDEKTHKIRIKDEYQNELDPYIFFRTPPLQRDIINSITAKDPTKRLDLVSGKFSEHFPDYLKAIQRNIYLSDLPKFLCRILKQINKEMSYLLQPTLKLILMNLQVGKRSLDDCPHNKHDLIKIIKENYMSGDFSESLSSILAQREYKDYELCIKKIQSMILHFSSLLNENFHIQVSNTSTLDHENAEDEKKRLAKDKAEKLKEEFAKKQALFADKNKDLLEKEEKYEEYEESKNESPITDLKRELICQYCLDKIQEHSEEYGIPISITFTNNFYDIEEEVTFQKENYYDFLKTNWWPVISSCNHYYHKKCFAIHFRNSRNPQDKAAPLFSNQYESYCLFCKTVCNHFLCITSNRIPSSNKPNNEIESQDSFNLDLPLIIKVEEILDATRTNLLWFSASEELEEKNLIAISFEIIFKRAYHYFLESLHFQTKSVQFEKIFELYTIFFNHYKISVPHKLEGSTNTDSFFDRVFTQKESLDDFCKGQESHGQFISFENMCESVINDILFEILTKFSSKEASESEGFKKAHFDIMKDYIAFYAFHIFSIEKECSTNEFFKISFEYKENEIFRNKLLSLLKSPIKKMIAAYCLNMYAISNDVSNIHQVCKLLCQSDNDELDSLDNLISLGGIPFSFREVIEVSISELLKKPQSVMNSLITMRSSFKSKLEVKSLRIRRMAPRCLELPSNFAEFNDKYFRRKCSLCKQFSKNLLTSICLICGELMCSFFCQVQDNKFGNLNRHACEYHMGLGLFLDIQKFEKAVISSPLSLVFAQKHIYIDEFGQPIQGFIPNNVRKNMDFTKFTLKKEAYQYLENIIKNHSMNKEIFEKFFAQQGDFRNGGEL